MVFKVAFSGLLFCSHFYVTLWMTYGVSGIRVKVINWNHYTHTNRSGSKKLFPKLAIGFWASTLLLVLSRFSRVQLLRPHRRQPTRLSHPWDSLGKNTGVGCHFLFQCMKVKSQSEVPQSCPTLSDPMDCSLPGSSIHGIFQARVLKWVPSPSPWASIPLH